MFNTELDTREDIERTDILKGTPTVLYEHQFNTGGTFYQVNGYEYEDGVRAERVHYIVRESIITFETETYRVTDSDYLYWDSSTYSIINHVGGGVHTHNHQHHDVPAKDRLRTVERVPNTNPDPVNDEEWFSGSGWMLEGAYQLHAAKTNIQLVLGMQAVEGVSVMLYDESLSGVLITRESEKLYRHETEIREFSFTVPPSPPWPGFTTNEYEQEEAYIYVSDNFDATQQDQLINTVSIDSRADLYSIWIGMELSQPISKHITVGCSPRISAHLVDIEAEREEFFINSSSGEILETWSQSDQTQKAAWGLGLAFDVSCALNSKLFCKVQVMYDWVVDDVVHEVGPAELIYELSSFQGSFLAGYRF